MLVVLKWRNRVLIYRQIRIVLCVQVQLVFVTFVLRGRIQGDKSERRLYGVRYREDQYFFYYCGFQDKYLFFCYFIIVCFCSILLAVFFFRFRVEVQKQFRFQFVVFIRQSGQREWVFSVGFVSRSGVLEGVGVRFFGFVFLALLNQCRDQSFQFYSGYRGFNLQFGQGQVQFGVEACVDVILFLGVGVIRGCVYVTLIVRGFVGGVYL